MSSKVDYSAVKVKLLADSVDAMKDLRSWKKQSEEILLMKLLSPEMARCRSRIAESRFDTENGGVVKVKARSLDDLNRVVEDVKKRQRVQKSRTFRDVSEKLSLYPGGDIFLIKIDAIVIPTKESKLHRQLVMYGGPSLEKEIKREINRKIMSPGDVIHTNGYNLLAKHVIHCEVPESKPKSVHSVEGVRLTEVTPSSKRSTMSQSNRESLSCCYSRALDIALKTGSRTIAFPTLGTGTFGLPNFECAAVAVETVQEWIETHHLESKIDRIIFIVRDGQDHEAYERLMMECFPFCNKNKNQNPLLPPTSYSSPLSSFDLPSSSLDDTECGFEEASTTVDDLEKRLARLLD
jgi:O-acetyl-ADP-ribose deacetylase (regulator of RNase III)